MFGTVQVKPAGLFLSCCSRENIDVTNKIKEPPQTPSAFHSPKELQLGLSIGKEPGIPVSCIPASPTLRVAFLAFRALNFAPLVLLQHEV